MKRLIGVKLLFTFRIELSHADSTRKCRSWWKQNHSVALERLGCVVMANYTDPHSAEPFTIEGLAQGTYRLELNDQVWYGGGTSAESALTFTVGLGEQKVLPPHQSQSPQ